MRSADSGCRDSTPSAPSSPGVAGNGDWLPMPTADADAKPAEPTEPDTTETDNEEN